MWDARLRRNLLQSEVKQLTIPYVWSWRSFAFSEAISGATIRPRSLVTDIVTWLACSKLWNSQGLYIEAIISTYSWTWDLTFGSKSAARFSWLRSIWIAALALNCGSSMISLTSSNNSPLTVSLDFSSQCLTLSFQLAAALTLIREVLAESLLRCSICFNSETSRSVFQSTSRRCFSATSFPCHDSLLDDWTRGACSACPLLVVSAWLLGPDDLDIADITDLPSPPRMFFNQYVWSSPFPLAVTLSSRGTTQWFLPRAANKFAVSCETWILFLNPVDSILAVVFTVSPNSWNLALSPRSTPAVTGPEWSPIRIPSSPVLRIYFQNPEQWTWVPTNTSRIKVQEVACHCRYLLRT